MRAPVRIQSVAPPGIGQVNELQHGDDLASGPSCEPGLYVAFRPEEQDRASCVPDVVPPRCRRNENVEYEIGVIRTGIPDGDVDRRAAVGAIGLDDAIGV